MEADQKQQEEARMGIQAQINQLNEYNMEEDDDEDEEDDMDGHAAGFANQSDQYNPLRHKNY